MEIFYNSQQKKWQNTYKKNVYFGKNFVTIEKSSKQHPPLLKVKTHNNKVGPLVAILANRNGRHDFYGNRNTFKKIQQELQLQGGISFVMTPDRLHEQYAKGYFYHEGEWYNAIFPLPDVIYNRVASYKTDQQLQRVKKIAQQNKIPFYNPHFFEKWEIYKQLILNPFCKHYLPETELLTSVNQLKKWLTEVQAILIKPVLSNRGKGIVTVSIHEQSFVIRTNEWQKEFEKLVDVWEEIKANTRVQPLIIQRKIPLKQYKGRSYDFRVLVQRCSNEWTVTGIGVRCASPNAITTHVPHGGEIISMEAVNGHVHTPEIEFIAKQIAYQLELAYGYLCEFSLDIGVDENNKLWIFEVNSKPMKFDEQHIQQKGLTTLIQCFNYDSLFP